MSYTRTRLMALQDAIVTETSMATPALGLLRAIGLDMATRADVHIQCRTRMSDLRKTLLREDVYSDMFSTCSAKHGATSTVWNSSTLLLQFGVLSALDWSRAKMPRSWIGSRTRWVSPSTEGAADIPLDHAAGERSVLNRGIMTSPACRRLRAGH